jgi:acetyl-CoA C-acetyltransferase
MAAGLDPRLPVLVGAGQITQRVRDGDPTLEPAELMAEALRRAEDDSGASGVLGAADSIQVVGEVSAMYPDPGALVAERIGATPRETVKAVMGGSWMGWMLNHAAADIQAGRADVVLLTGGEAWVSAVQARRQGRQLGWATQPDGTEPTRIVGNEAPLLSSTENARGLLMPVQVYPLFEIAVRAIEGEAPEAHRRRIGELFERFAARFGTPSTFRTRAIS